MDDDAPLSFPDAPRTELDRVLDELVRRASEVLDVQGRLRALLKANQAVVQQLDLPVVLRRIVDVAVELVDAQYGALGVIAPDGRLEQFIHTGMPPEAIQAIGHLPEGNGLLRAVIDDPRPIRLRHIADDPRSAGFPAGHPPMDSFLGVPIRIRGKVFGNLYLTNQRSGEFTIDDEELVGALAVTAGIAIDNAQLFAETNRRQAWATASAEITAALLASEENSPVALLASRVLTLSGAHLVCVMLPTADPTQLIVDTARGDGAESLEKMLIPAAGSAAGGVIEGRQPRILDELAANEAVPAAGPRLGPTMAVPLIAVGRVLGALVVSRKPQSVPFTPADLEIAADFAGRASVAMELSSARADRHRLLLLEDRGRIARDLHDHVIQQLFATGLELQSVAGMLPPGQTSERVDAAVAGLDTAIAQIRTAIFALTNSPRDTVRHLIMDVVNELGPELPRTPQLGFTGPIDLVIRGELVHDVIAVVREALTNVVKHAAAEHVSITLTATERDVVLEVVDDGVGAPRAHGWSGLANLETRALKNAGTFSFASDDGETRLCWSALIRA